MVKPWKFEFFAYAFCCCFFIAVRKPIEVKSVEFDRSHYQFAKWMLLLMSMGKYRRCQCTKLPHINRTLFISFWRTSLNDCYLSYWKVNFKPQIQWVMHIFTLLCGRCRTPKQSRWRQYIYGIRSLFYTNLYPSYLELSRWVHSKTLNHHTNNSFTFRANTCSGAHTFSCSSSLVFFLHLLILPAHSFDCTFHTPTKNDLTHCFFFSSSPTKPRLTDLFYNARAYWWAIDGVIFHNHSHVQHDSAIIQLKIPLFLSVCFFVFTKHHCTITTMSNWIVVAVFAHSFFPRYFRCCKLNWENWQAPAIILPYMLL